MILVIFLMKKTSQICLEIQNYLNMRKLAFTLLTALFMIACGKEKSQDTNAGQTDATPNNEVSDYDPSRGEGKHTNIELSPNLDKAMADSGKRIAEVKCLSCHKLSDERLVGPGWQGVTERRTPEWLMNFVTNPDPMIDKDPELQAQLEICLVRMPNQSVSDEDARQILEFMRENDGVQ